MPGADAQPADLPPLPPRDPAGHKGTFGTVCILGGCAGSTRMIGAPTLAAIAALRAGAGLARLMVPAPILNAAIAIAPSATGLALPVDDEGLLIASDACAGIDAQAEACRCLVVGPGLGVSDGTRAAALRAIQQERTHVVLDADAINALADLPELVRDFRAPVVLTPHPGEFRRLARGLSISLDPTSEGERPGAAEALAQRLGCVVVLKGAGSVVADGHRTWINPSGHPCLATAGTGDVLSGLIAGLICQFVPDPDAPQRTPEHDPSRPLDLFDAARLGVHIHGLAGQRWASAHHAQGGLLATELADLIPTLIDDARR